MTTSAALGHRTWPTASQQVRQHLVILLLGLIVLSVTVGSQQQQQHMAGYPGRPQHLGM